MNEAPAGFFDEFDGNSDPLDEKQQDDEDNREDDGSNYPWWSIIQLTLISWLGMKLPSINNL